MRRVPRRVLSPAFRASFICVEIESATSPIRSLRTLRAVILWVLLGVVALAAGAIAYGIFIERRWYRVGRYRLDILPAGTSELSVLHLSDLHMLDGDRRAERFLSKLPRADVAVITGDIVGEPEAVEFAARALRAVRGRVASLFVLGSNDLYAPRPLNPFRYFRHGKRHRRVVGRKG